jgi:transposase-like protein
MLVCPSCGSSRVRNGYKPAFFLLRIVGIRALLCDNCNFPFQAFSPFPPKNRRPKQTAKADVYPVAPAVDLGQLKPSLPVSEQRELKLVAPVQAKQPVKQVAPIGLAVAAKTETVANRAAPVRQGLRTEITKLYAQHVQEKPDDVASAIQQSSINCPECQSRNIKRRRRNFFERTFMAFSDHKPYVCRNCDAAFYSKSDEGESNSHGVGRAEAA